MDFPPTVTARISGLRRRPWQSGQGVWCVRFPKAIDNYSENYMVQGSSDHIANLSYYKDGGQGVLEIKLDKACEHFYSYKDGFLRMEFKDLHEVYEKIVVVDAGHGR